MPATIATYPADLDTDGDQLSDLAEFAMGLDVYESSTPHQPTLASINGGTELRFEFPQRDDLALHPISLGVESSFTLRNGSWFPLATQPGVLVGRWEVIVTAPTTANARQFFRFRIETP